MPNKILITSLKYRGVYSHMGIPIVRWCKVWEIIGGSSYYLRTKICEGIMQLNQQVIH